MRDHPLATLVSLADDGLIASHLPMLWDPVPAPFCWDWVLALG
jgi:predicted FMN-binding regulatory protein PaiB